MGGALPCFGDVRHQQRDIVDLEAFVEEHLPKFMTSVGLLIGFYCFIEHFLI